MDEYKPTGKKKFIFYNLSKTKNCLVDTYYEPISTDEIKQILEMAKTQKLTVKVVGCGHSFSDIACTNGFMLSLHQMNQVIEINLAKKLVTVQAGITLEELNKILLEHKLALPVTGAVFDVTVGGIISTGTHGSSTKFGNMCSLVTQLTMITADGKSVTCNREENKRLFLAAACSLGSLGIITEVTLQCVEAHQLEVVKYGDNLDKVLSNIDNKLASNEHFEFIWYPHTNNVTVWEHNITTEKQSANAANWFRDKLVIYYLLMVLCWIGSYFPCIIPVINKAYYVCLYSKPQRHVKQSYNALQYVCPFKKFVTEWSIPRSQVAVASMKIQEWLKQSGYKAHFPVEFRFVKGDDIYLSPAYGGDRCFINIVCRRLWMRDYEYQDFFQNFEDIMYSLGGRPHWAKQHNKTGHELQKVYPMKKEFEVIRQELDPNGTFMNRYLRQVFSN